MSSKRENVITGMLEKILISIEENNTLLRRFLEVQERQSSNKETRILRDREMKPPLERVYKELAQSGKPMSTKQLASNLQLDRSTISRYLNELKDQGWIGKYRSDGSKVVHYFIDSESEKDSITLDQVNIGDIVNKDPNIAFNDYRNHSEKKKHDIDEN